MRVEELIVALERCNPEAEVILRVPQAVELTSGKLRGIGAVEYQVASTSQRAGEVAINTFEEVVRD